MKPVRHAFTISVATMSIMSVLFAVTAFAQMEELRNTSPAQRAKIQTAFMKMKLKLTPQQTQQVGSINLKYAEQMDPVIKGSDGKMRKMREAKMIDQAKDGELQTVLSPDQYGRYMASKEEMRHKLVEKIKAKRSNAG